MLRGRGRVERTRGVCINAATSQQTRDNRGGGKSAGDGDGDSKCRVQPPQDLAATALVLAAEAAAELITDDADGGNSGIAIVGRVSLAAGDG